MLIPELLLEDLHLIPEGDVDIKIWINESLIFLRDRQPFFYKYLSQIKLVNGDQACIGVLLTFLAVEHALERDNEL